MTLLFISFLLICLAVAALSIGVISVGDVMKANLRQITEELEKLQGMVKLEYYEKGKAIQAEK